MRMMYEVGGCLRTCIVLAGGSNRESFLLFVSIVVTKLALNSNMGTVNINHGDIDCSLSSEERIIHIIV